MTDSHKTVQSGLNLPLHDTQEHHMYKGLMYITFKSKLVTFPVSMPDVLDCEQSLFSLMESITSEQAAKCKNRLWPSNTRTCRAASVVSRTERPQTKPQQLTYALLS